MPRPTLFVGSSSEGLSYAKALQLNLDRSCQVVLWSQGVFGLSAGTLEELVSKLSTVDFAALVVTPDDLTISRGKRSASPRDNVLLELGIAIGTLGQERTFLVYDRSRSIKLPSDLAGVTNANFEPHDDNNAQAAVGAACTLIEQSITNLGERAKYGRAGLVDEDSQYRIIADLLGLVAVNYLIQMYETGSTLKRERGMFTNLGNYWYGIDFPGRHQGSGRFSANDLCEKLLEAGVIAQDLKFNIALTERGKVFATWLQKSDYRAKAFISPLGKWGKMTEFMKTAIQYFHKDA